MSTKNRRADNRIKKLIDDLGKEWLAERDLGRVAEEYFKIIFTSEDIGIVLEDHEVKAEDLPRVSPQQNEMLLSPVTRDEVHRVVLEINLHKYPGPDGMNVILPPILGLCWG